MHLKYRHVGNAFHEMVQGIQSGAIPTVIGPSRNGEVIQINEPVTVTYHRPIQRVLLNEVRDANPFFHVYESLFMLAGREDVRPLAYYNSKISNYSDDGVTFNGAYGHRWRHADTSVEERDQLAIIIEHLKAKPESRRAVLQMWDVESDLMQIHDSLDVPCNVCVFFAVESGKCSLCDANPNLVASCSRCGGKPHEQPRFLNMTVCNRSNDLIWGMLGANVVHFSILQEYMAAHLGLEMGVYNQFSNNCHVYTSNWKPDEWISWEDTFDRRNDPYENDDFKPLPLVSNPETFDKELPEFVERHSRDAVAKHYDEPFLSLVAQPMMLAYHFYKRGNLDTALNLANMIVADDWRQASVSWLKRRKEKREAKRGISSSS